MADQVVPPLKPSGTDMSASTTTTTLQPLEKLTPRQQAVGQTTATSNDQAAAAAAAAITTAAAATTTTTTEAAATTTSAKKKRPLTLDINTKFDPESPSTYHSSVLCCWLFRCFHCIFYSQLNLFPSLPHPPPYVNSQLQITIHVWYTKGHDHAQRKSKIICFLSKNTSVEATGNHQRRRTFTARTTKTNTDHTRKPTPKPRRSVLRRQQMVLALQP